MLYSGQDLTSLSRNITSVKHDVLSLHTVNNKFPHEKDKISIHSSTER